MPETSNPPRSQPRPQDYVVVDGSDGPRRDFRISVGLREGWDAEGRVFDVSEAVRTARAWMRRRVEAGEPALSGMFTRAEVTYAWPRDDGSVGSDREPVALFTGEAVHAYLGHLLGRRDRGDAERACRRTRRRARAGAHLCRLRRPDLDPRRRGPRVAGVASPFSAKRGRCRVAADGVWKAGLGRCRFAATVVQSDLHRSSGPHPIRRFAPPSPAKLGKGPAPLF